MTFLVSYTVLVLNLNDFPYIISSASFTYANINKKTNFNFPEKKLYLFTDDEHFFFFLKLNSPIRYHVNWVKGEDIKCVSDF